MKRFLLFFVAFSLCLSSFAQIVMKDGATVEWAPGDFAKTTHAELAGNAYDLMVKEVALDAVTEGFYSVTFNYSSGVYALHIMGVELVDENGNVLLKDYHYGEAGLAPRNNVYKMYAISEAKAIRFYVENYKPIDSKGTIAFSVLDEKLSGDDTWKPTDWTAVNGVSEKVQGVHADFATVDGKSYVKMAETLVEFEKGVYTFDFNYTSGASSLRIGAVELLTLNGEVVCGDYHYGQAGSSSSTFNNQYMLKVYASGKYIIRYYCSNKSAGNNSTGNVSIAYIPGVNTNGGTTEWVHITGLYASEKDMSMPFYTIAEGDVPAGILALSSDIKPSDVRVCERIVTVDELSMVNVEFEYQTGKFSLNLAGVDLVDGNGNVVASHYKTYAENASVVSKYALAPVAPGEYIMRCFVQLSAENHTRKIDSKGAIKLSQEFLKGISASENNVDPSSLGWNSTTFVSADTVPQSIVAAGSKRVRVMKAIVHVDGNGFVLNADFKYGGKDGGNHSLDVAGVDIVDANGKVLASDYHFAAFGVKSGTPYKLNVTTPGKYVLRIFNGQENATTRVVNSYGNILLSVNKKAFETSTLNLSKNYYYIKGENGKYIYAKSGAAVLVDSKEDASKFYFEKNGSVYDLISFEAGLYMDFSNDAMRVAAVGGKSGISLGKGFVQGNSVLVKNGESFLANDLTFTNSIHGNISWSLEEVESLSFSISSLRHASLCLPVEVMIPDGVKVYTLGSIDVDLNEGTGTLGLVRIYDYIPANEPVVLYSAMPLDDTTWYDFNITTTGATLSDENLFEGVYVKTNVPTDSNKIYYILTKPAGHEVGFYNVKVTDGKFVLGANKMYFGIDKAVAASLSRGMTMTFRDIPATGIDEVFNDDCGEKVVYDLMGRRVKCMSAPGIYLVNGQKVLVK